jgi:transcriptional regulator with XRE-family HTH domain
MINRFVVVTIPIKALKPPRHYVQDAGLGRRWGSRCCRHGASFEGICHRICCTLVNVQTVRSLTYNRVPVQSMPGIAVDLSGRRGVRLVGMTAHAADGRRGLPGDSAVPEHAINPLQCLIRQRLRERGWSYGEVARRGGLPRSTVYTLATTRNLVRPPRPATIDALAGGLDMPVSAVRAAAAESAGLHYYDEAPAGRRDRERELLIASIDELSTDDRRHVAVLVESLRKRASAREDR